MFEYNIVIWLYMNIWINEKKIYYELNKKMWIIKIFFIWEEKLIIRNVKLFIFKFNMKIIRKIYMIKLYMEICNYVYKFYLYWIGNMNLMIMILIVMCYLL